MPKRVFLIVLDSFGIGNAPDAAAFSDEGSNTLATVAQSPKFYVPAMQALGLYNIVDVTLTPKAEAPKGSFARLVEVSKGKDTTIGHWEIAGQVSLKPLPTFPNGFPKEMMEEFETRTGRKTLCHKPYSGTDVIRDYGEEQMRTGALIVYTSADSVFQIAANEEIIPLEELYRCCEIARAMLTGEWGMGRVIARPFVGNSKNTFKRTANRHDYSLRPPAPTILDDLVASGRETIGVGKISDIYAGQGITESLASKSNNEGMQHALALVRREFEGIAFINLVDFDMLYGHRNDVHGYAAALTEFDEQLAALMGLLQPEDLLLITADHGCDPGTPSTDHSRECVPLLAYGEGIKTGVNLGTASSFATVANLVASFFGLPPRFAGADLWPRLQK